ncbi:MAG: quinol:cytochrome C oxidoreductase, partial [Flavobacterium sp.]|nr:quinol:cytochrome C oxidoreductase [Flavobacterium sp.]
MYTFSSKLKTFSFILMAVGLLGIGYGFLTAPKDIQEVEKLLAADTHGSHGVAKHEESKSSHEANVASEEHADAAVVAKEAAEHEEHLNHVLHQLQNKPWSALYV